MPDILASEKLIEGLSADVATLKSQRAKLQSEVRKLKRECACPCCRGTGTTCIGETCSECKSTGKICISYETARVHEKLASEQNDRLKLAIAAFMRGTKLGAYRDQILGQSPDEMVTLFVDEFAPEG